MLTHWKSRLNNYFNNFYDNSASNGQGAFAPIFNFNPIEKLIESYDENKKLYERLVQAEKDKVEYLEKLLKAK